MPDQRNIEELEIAQLIVSTLHLELSANEIKPSEPLFYDGLGLDSIDALELSLEVDKRYGIEIDANSEKTEEIFASLKSFTNYLRGR